MVYLSSSVPFPCVLVLRCTSCFVFFDRDAFCSLFCDYGLGSREMIECENIIVSTGRHLVVSQLETPPITLCRRNSKRKVVLESNLPGLMPLFFFFLVLDVVVVACRARRIRPINAVSGPGREAVPVANPPARKPLGYCQRQAAERHVG